MKYFFHRSLALFVIMSFFGCMTSIAFLILKKSTLVDMTGLILSILLMLMFAAILLENENKTNNSYGLDEFFYQKFTILKTLDGKTRRSYIPFIFQCNEKYKKIDKEKKAEFQEKINQILDPILKEAEEKIKQKEQQLEQKKEEQRQKRIEQGQFKKKKKEIELNQILEVYQEKLPLKKPND